MTDSIRAPPLRFLHNKAVSCSAALSTRRRVIYAVLGGTSYRVQLSLNGTRPEFAWSLIVTAMPLCDQRALLHSLLAHVSVECRPDFLLIVRSRRPSRHLLLAHRHLSGAPLYRAAFHFRRLQLFVKLGSRLRGAHRIRKCAPACFVFSSEP